MHLIGAQQKNSKQVKILPGAEVKGRDKIK